MSEENIDMVGAPWWVVPPDLTVSGTEENWWEDYTRHRSGPIPEQS